MLRFGNTLVNAQHDSNVIVQVLPSFQEMIIIHIRVELVEFSEFRREVLKSVLHHV